MTPEADPGFSFRGRKRLCARTHITSAKPNSLSAGVQGSLLRQPLKGPESSRVVLMLSRACYLNLNFKHSDLKIG